MIGVKTRMTLFFTVVLGIAGLCVFAVYHKPTEERVKHERTTFDRNIADGMRLWNPKAGVDSIRFDACRIEKMKMGAFYLGAFDVLCLDGLVLNLPFPRDAEDSEMTNDECRMQNDGRGVMEAFAELLPRSFLQRAGMPVRNFSGIKIKGLVVNKVENKCEVPVFAADGAKNYRQTLKLRNCRVFEPGRTNSVGVAYVVLQPSPALVWKDGVRKLDDLLPNFSGGDGRARLDEAAAAVSSKPPYRRSFGRAGSMIPPQRSAESFPLAAVSSKPPYRRSFGRAGSMIPPRWSTTNESISMKGEEI